MKIQYISDLHLEFKNNIDGLIHINNKADILIIAGDLNVGSNIFTTLIELSKKQIVIFVYGNHEFYDYKPIWKFKKKGSLVSKYNKNLHILDKNSIIIDNTTFIGTTGWIDGSFRNIDVVQHKSYNDFYKIKEFKRNHKNWGIGDREFIKHSISTSKTKHNIIITHFLPITECISDKYKNNYINPCFTNNWQWIFDYSNKIDYWIHGHSHEYFKKDIGNITFCRNPFGYPKEKVNFKLNDIINID